jgi:excisionase family DNA binding protein
VTLVAGITTHPVLYTPAEVAELTRLGKTKVFELIGSGAIESVRIGSRRRVSHDALLRYVASLSDTTGS